MGGGSDNTADGAEALYKNTGGNNNVAAGYQALYKNTTGSNNVAVGVSALSNSTNDSQLVAIGYQALQNDNASRLGVSITSGDNTAIGYQALQANTIGSDNAAIGYQALQANSTGVGNAAIGSYVLSANTSGNNNVAEGFQTLIVNTSGSANTALDVGAGGWIQSGNNNTAIGDGALANLGFALFNLGYTTGGGSNNIALGYNAGINFETNESYNIDIGNPGTTGENNIIRIGNGQTATYLAGNVYTASGTVEMGSDRNTKEDFAAVNPQSVLAKVAGLPITEWNYKTTKNMEHIGPMAQDFHAAFGLNGPDDKHISVVDEGGVALAAIQGLNEKVDEKDAEIQTLKQQNDSLAQRLSELEATVKQLAAQK
jgi:hypothetical protein